MREEKEEKLNFNNTIVSSFWKKSDQKVSKAISIMENVEHWVLDDVPEVAKELIAIGKKINLASKDALNENANEITLMMAYISCGKALRLLNWLNETYPNLSFYYVLNARQNIENSKESRLLIDRLQTIKTLSLLNKVFSEERTNTIIDLLKESNEENNK